MSAMTSFEVCGLGAVGRVAMLLDVAVLDDAHGRFLGWIVLSWLFHSHALAQAHACRGDKGKSRIPFPKGGCKPGCTNTVRKIKVALARARDGVPPGGLISSPKRALRAEEIALGELRKVILRGGTEESKETRVCCLVPSSSLQTEARSPTHGAGDMWLSPSQGKKELNHLFGDGDKTR